MLAQSYPSPSNSRGSTPAAATGASSSKKRKQHPLATAATASPAPEASPGPQDPNAPAANVVLPGKFDLFSRPRLTISRFPTFPPPDPSSSSGQPTYYQTEQLAINRIGYRYVPAGVAPPGSTLPCRTIESTPTSFRVSWEDRSPFVRVTPDGLGLLGDKGYRSARCNAPVREGAWYMEVVVERGGGEMADPTGKAREGGHVRLGWARREAPLNGPVGLDGYSYGLRDKSGDKVTLSRPRPYGRGFGTGDVIGMYISLPPRREPDPKDPHDPAHLKRERIAIEFKGQEYFESLEYAQTKEMTSLLDFTNKSSSTASLPSAPTNKKSAATKNLPDRGRAPGAGDSAPQLRALPTLPGSRIAFFVNGQCQGVAFQDVYDYIPLPSNRKKSKENSRKRPREGAPREHKENPHDDGTLGYYPFISLFNHARVRINPGPDFQFPPPDDVEAILAGEDDEEDKKPAAQRTWRPICERYPDFMKEQWVLDDKEEAEAAAVAKASAAEEEQRAKAEAQKQAQREKRKMQAEARKRAKLAEQEEQRASASRAASLVAADDRFGPSSSVSLTHDLPSATHSPAPTVDSDVNAMFQDAVGGYSSEAGEVGPYTEGDGDTDFETHIDDPGLGRPKSHHSPRTRMPDIDMDLEELL